MIQLLLALILHTTRPAPLISVDNGGASLTYTLTPEDIDRLTIKMPTCPQWAVMTEDGTLWITKCAIDEGKITRIVIQSDDQYAVRIEWEEPKP